MGGVPQDQASTVLDLPDGNYQLGLRVEWVKVQRELGGWQVQDTKILGTDAGEVRVLLTVACGDHRLQAEAIGAWAKGDKVGVTFAKFVVFDDGKAVVLGNYNIG